MSENKGFQEFMQVYTKLLVAAWTDQGVADRLKVEPHAVAADAGLIIPADVKITVVDTAGETADDPQAAMQAYYQDFQKGLAEKSVILAVPPAPQVDAKDLNAEDLVDVAGGISCCCCCPPCCCCWG